MSFETIYSRIADLAAQRVYSLNSKGNSKGNVLLSYITSPFGLHVSNSHLKSHSNEWECYQIALTWRKLGYSVDIINWNDDTFIPKRKYSVFIDIHNNMERLAPLLGEDCIKILHITGAHWLFQNNAEYNRLLKLQQRRGVTLLPRRLAKPCLGIEHADCATIIGNQFTKNTFNYSKKTLYSIPVSPIAEYPWFNDKDYNKCRSNFLWIGSGGLVLRGLDLVLEAFSQMQDYHLTVCGSIHKEKDFENAYHKELYQSSNIHTIGWVDVTSPKFVELLKNNIGLIYPSASEGQSGSVIQCMHGGLIPIISYQSGVDIKDSGVILKECTVSEIIHWIEQISSLPENQLRLMSKKVWDHARSHHSREEFTKEYRKSVQMILTENERKQ
jgi:hypothetical protein